MSRARDRGVAPEVRIQEPRRAPAVDPYNQGTSYDPAAPHHGPSQPEGTSIHRWGAVGTGAKASIVAAAKVDPQPAALVSLSPEAAIQRVPVAPSAAQVRCPALFVTGDDDGYGSTPAAKNFYTVSPSTDKKLVVIPGNQHGVELLSRPDVSGVVIEFLTAHLGWRPPRNPDLSP